MRPGVIRTDGHTASGPLPHIQEQSIVFGASNSLVLGERPNQLSGPLEVHKRKYSPAVPIRRGGTRWAAGWLKRVALRETGSIRVCHSGEVDRLVQRRRHEH